MHPRPAVVSVCTTLMLALANLDFDIAVGDCEKVFSEGCHFTGKDALCLSHPAMD